jgi:hypothetical protein
VHGEESKVITRRQRVEVGQVRAWGQRDDRWPMVLGMRWRRGRRGTGWGIPILGDGPEWPIGPRWAAHGEKQGGLREGKKGGSRLGHKADGVGPLLGST